MSSWMRDGIAGLQSVVLYSLPELDGAIDTIPLGGLVGDAIYLVPERVSKVRGGAGERWWCRYRMGSEGCGWTRWEGGNFSHLSRLNMGLTSSLIPCFTTQMASRVRRWVELRRKPPSERRVAILMYGFPPGVGATGTAALLNVPRSLEGLLHRMRAEGYDLGPGASTLPEHDTRWEVDGEALVTGLKMQEDQRVVAQGAAGMQRKGVGAGAEAAGFSVSAAEVSPADLKVRTIYESWKICVKGV